MKRVWIALALLAAVGMLSLGTSALAKKGKSGGLNQGAVNNHFAPVPKTGLTQDYPTVINDDGELQMGIPWPQPRFTHNGDGTVTDNLTNLVWTRNANLFEPMHWESACYPCNELADGTNGLADGSQPGDWRLPNVRELQSLVNYDAFYPALPEGHPFYGVQFEIWTNVYYWSSTTRAYPAPLSLGCQFRPRRVYIHQQDPIRAPYSQCVVRARR